MAQQLIEVDIDGRTSGRTVTLIAELAVVSEKSLQARVAF